MKPIVEAALNSQLNAEFASSHLYLSMSGFCSAKNLDGFAHWMFLQYQEEMAHTMKFFKYINDRGGRVTLSAIPQPKNEWTSPLELLEETLTHEKGVTERINALVELAANEKDYATHQFLQWYVAEQVEEEAMLVRLIERFRMIKDAPQALYFMDREMASRSAGA